MKIIPTTPIVTQLDNTSVLLANSNIDLSTPLEALPSKITNSEIYIWVWKGAQNAPPSTPNYILAADRLIEADDYINYNIDGIIKSFIDGITFQYNGLYSVPIASEQCVFVHVSANVSYDNKENWTYQTGVTKVATLGYNKTVGDKIINDRRNDKLFSKNIPNYFVQAFNFLPIASQTTTNVIATTVIAPTATTIEREQTLIIFLNSLGLWEVFTCFGRVVETEPIEKESVSSSFRRPQTLNISTNFGTRNISAKSIGSYLIATGLVPTASTEIVAEINYSPFIYLIRFTGNFGSTAGSAGITIDNSIITVDSDLFSIDNEPVPAGTSDFYKSFIQIPVEIKSSTFARKSDINDRAEKEYILELKETFSRIKNIR